jgi:transcriptional regulator with XRE-family HTH domain
MFSKELFCKRLKALRLEKKLTLEQLGLLFDVTKQTTSRWETGDRIPSIEILCILADYFNVSLDYLTGRTDEPVNPNVKNNQI